MIVGSAVAQEAEDSDPDAVDKSCGKVVGEVVKMAANEAAKDLVEQAGEIGTQYKSMRDSCSGLRTCKRDCRQSKRDAIKKCRSLKGKEKRQCKRDARRARRSCKASCRSQLEASDCRSGRQSFWKGVGGLLKGAASTALKSKAESLDETCNPLYVKTK